MKALRETCNMLIASLSPTLIILITLISGAPGIRDEERPHLTASPGSMKIVEGQKATFRCSVTHKNSHKVVWTRSDTQQILSLDTKVIVDDTRYKLTHHGKKEFVLIIDKVLEKDQGDYMCQMNTEPPRFSIVQLEVVVAPKFIDHLTSSDQIIDENDNVTLTCAAHGNPKPNITWQREDGRLIVIQNSHVYVHQGTTLQLSSVTRHQAGSYQCLATNGVPSAISRSIQLRVRYKPIVNVMRSMVEAYDGSNCTLECKVTAYPPPSTFWEKNGEMIAPTPGKYSPKVVVVEGDTRLFSLTIFNIQDDDFGIYYCSVNNNVETSKTGKILLKNGKGENKMRHNRNQKHLEVDMDKAVSDGATPDRASRRQSAEGQKDSLYQKNKGSKNSFDHRQSGVSCLASHFHVTGYIITIIVTILCMP